MIKTVFANVGAGKTTLLAKIACEENRKIEKGKSKYKGIITNTPLKLKNAYFYDDIRKLLKNYVVEDTLILIDEGSIVYNNRKMSMTELEILFFKYHRHFNCDVIIVSQSYDDIDITIRRISTELWHMVKLFGLSILRPISKKISIDDNTKQIIDKYFFRSIFNYKLILRCKYYKYFDTRYRPENLKYYDYKNNLEYAENKEKLENSKHSENDNKMKVMNLLKIHKSKTEYSEKKKDVESSKDFPM
jgi:hypothetical protein